MFYVYLVFLVSYMPHYCVIVAYLMQSSPSTALRGVYLYSRTLVFLNSSLNPVIYGWKMRHIRYDRRTAKYIFKAKPSKLVVTRQFSCKNNFSNVSYCNKQFFSTKKLTCSSKFSVFEDMKRNPCTFGRLMM